MIENILKIDSSMTNIEILAERIKLLTEDLNQGYFGQEITDKGDLWMIGGSYYDSARIRTDIILSMIHDIKNATTEIQDNLSELLTARKSAAAKEDERQ